MPTPGLRSLGLDATRRAARCQRSVHSGLFPIGHECATGARGGGGGAWTINAPKFEGFMGHECSVARGVRRS
jgi:hypothetical protein